MRSWDDCFDGALIEDPLEGELPTAALFADNLRDGGLDTNNAAKSIPLKIIDSTQIAKERNLIGCEASHVAAGLSNHDTVLPPKFEVTDCDVTKTVKQSASACSRVAQGSASMFVTWKNGIFNRSLFCLFYERLI